MCGIAGYIGKPQQSVIERMTRSLVHRGPDDEGYFVSDRVALGMRRLKIIDLEGGRQPMFSEDKKVVVVFNGEIYNFKAVREELEKSGARFRTNSDTEVFIHGYHQWGSEIFNKLDGMFAVAIWDEGKQQLILARDRFGEKPLYYGSFGNSFIFGSELKALLLHPAVKKELNYEAFSKYLTFEYVPAPLSIFKNIWKLEPGCFLVYSDNNSPPPSSASGGLRRTGRSPLTLRGGANQEETSPQPSPQEERGNAFTIQRYWNIKFSEIDIFQEEAVQLLEEKLERAVVSRLIADVPLGVFLSGGIDSSTIAYFAQKNSSKKIKTFSIGFDDPSFDESGYARQVATHLGTDHHEHIFSTTDCIRVIPEVFEKLDEPLADPSILPTYLLARFTREQVTVALDGDGSDELFGGYPTFQARKFLPLLETLPRRLVAGFANLFPTSFDNITLEYGLKRMVASLRYPSLTRDFIWIGAAEPIQQQQLLTKQIQSEVGRAEVFSPLTRYLGEVSEVSEFNRIVYLYLKLYLQDDILAKSDRATMMVSLEGRAPFLAVELAEFISSLPAKFKMKGFTTKYLLKKVMAKHLPALVVARKKKGFGIPVARWLTAELKPFLHQLLNRDRIKREGYLNPDYIDQLIAEHQARKKDHRKVLWNLMVWQMWAER